MNVSKRKVILPTFIIPGAGKSGTSYVADVLGQHPDIFIPVFKEPAFFSTNQEHGLYNKGISFYQLSFNGYKGQSHIGEASTIYMYDPDSPSLIKKYIPDVKLIFVLRNPIDRVYSNYWQEIKAGKNLKDFKSMLFQNHPRIQEMITISFYSNYLKKYMELFDSENILILFYDDLKANNKAFFKNIFEFLNLNEESEGINFDSHVNVSAVPRSKLISRILRNQNLTQFVKALAPPGVLIHLKKGLEATRQKSLKPFKYPKMDQETRSHLSGVFKKSILELSELSNRDLTQWLEK